MLLRAIGELLPAALGVALNPFPVIAAVLLLAGSHGRRGGAAFAVGWVIRSCRADDGGGAVGHHGTSSMLFDWLRVAYRVGDRRLGWLPRARPPRESTLNPPVPSVDRRDGARARPCCARGRPLSATTWGRMAL